MVFEILGEPGSGKTHLIYLLTLQIILPPSRIALIATDTSQHSRGRLAMLLDCDGGWRWDRFSVLVDSHISKHLPAGHTLSSSERTALCHSSMQLVTVHRFPWTQNRALRLTASLLAMNARLRASQTTEELGLLVIDGMSSVVQQELAVQDAAEAAGLPSTPSALPAVFKAMREVHAPLTVFSTWDHTTTTYYTPITVPSSALEPAPLQPTHRIILQSNLVTLPKFPPEIRAWEAVADTDRRSIVELGLVSGDVRTESEPEVISQFRFEIRVDSMDSHERQSQPR